MGWLGGKGDMRFVRHFSSFRFGAGEFVSQDRTRWPVAWTYLFKVTNITGAQELSTVALGMEGRRETI